MKFSREPPDDGNLTITADARIDNRDELIYDLGLSERALIEISDSELILKSYEKWGSGLPGKIIRGFCFCDLGSTPSDRFFVPGTILVSNRSIIMHRSFVFVCVRDQRFVNVVPEIPRKLNETRVAEYLLILFWMSPNFL